MGHLSGVVQQLRKERERAQKVLTRIDAAIAALGSSGSNGHRSISAAGRRSISLAQTARWAKQKSSGLAGKTKPKRKMSVAARKKIATAQKARWAAWKAKLRKAA